MVCTLFGVPILLAAGTTAQYAQYGGFNGAYPTGNGYGQMAGYIGGGFGGYVGGGGYGGQYGGQYGRQCRSNVRSEDLQGGFQQCFCDKNHRDEDPCSGGYDTELFPTRRLLGIDEPECQKGPFKDYYDDIFDEDCVQRWERQTNVRRCAAKTSSKDLAGPAVCWCDSNHKKDYDDVEDAITACIADESCVGDSFSEDDAVGFYYSMKPSMLSSTIADDGSCCSSSLEQDMEDEMEKYDPNCVERFGGYGGYGQQFGGYGQQFGGYGQQFGGYGGFGMGYNAGYGQQFGGNMFYPTSFAQPAAAAPVDGAAPAPAAPTFQQQYYGGYPQMNFGGNFGGYRGYYGR